MKKVLLVLGILIGVGALFTLGTVAYASNSIEGFAEILEAGLDGLEAYFDFLIEVFELIYD